MTFTLLDTIQYLDHNIEFREHNDGTFSVRAVARTSMDTVAALDTLWANAYAHIVTLGKAYAADFADVYQISDYQGRGGNDDLYMYNGGSVATGRGNDDLYLYAGNGTAQIHAWGAWGNDFLKLDFSQVGTGFSHGHHVRGDYDPSQDNAHEIRGNDVFNFRALSGVAAGSTVVGRIDDFDYSRDHIHIEGTRINLMDIPAGPDGYSINGSHLKIVLWNGGHTDATATPQQWLLIKTPAGGFVMYALEGARVNPNATQHTGGGDHHNMREQEHHFVEQEHIDAIPGGLWAMEGVEYVDTKNTLPSTFDTTGYTVFQDNDDTLYAPSSGSSAYPSHMLDAFGQPVKIIGTTGKDAIAAGLNDDVVEAEGGNDVIWAGSGNDIIYGGGGNDAIYGGTGDDRLYGDIGNDRIFGGTNDDFISGHNGKDNLYGEAGNDTLVGGGGDDRIWAGTGEDDLNGGGGNDKLYGQAGDDTLNGADGDDILYGSDGKDRLEGADGVDRLFGGRGNDDLYGGDGDDYIQGDKGYDDIYGGNGEDELEGNNGYDDIDGGDGKDTIYGGNGNDTIRGGADEDFVYGGAGKDTFVFRDGDFVTISSGFREGVRDFEVGQDKVHLDLDSAVTLDRHFFVNSGSDVRFTAVYEDASGTEYKLHLYGVTKDASDTAATILSDIFVL